MSAAEDNPIPRLLAQARRSFRAFYDIATPDDQTWFDALVLGHWALNQGASAPRENMPDRAGFEKAADETERRFMQARDNVRNCATFAKLEPGHQQRIVDNLFEPLPPWGLPE